MIDRIEVSEDGQENFRNWNKCYNLYLEKSRELAKKSDLDKVIRGEIRDLKEDIEWLKDNMSRLNDYFEARSDDEDDEDDD